MSQTKKLPDKNRTDAPNTSHDEGIPSGALISCIPTESRTYAVTVSKKSSPTQESLCSSQKSFISIHSTDQLCQVADPNSPSNLEECNLEVLSLNEVFPSTSEESISEDDTPVQNKLKSLNKKTENQVGMAGKSTFSPMSSKSSTGSRQKEAEGQSSMFSDFDIPKNTLHVHKNEQNSKLSEKAISKLTTMRGILKDGRCGPECTGDSVQETEDYSMEDLTLPFPMDFSHHTNYTKQNPDKSVSFNTQVVIIHFTGDLCVGQSVETLSKEKDQQARNSELRKTFLTKYNEFWATEK
ncbi:Seminal fluid protein [Operophtera brumata]|uniref:Seminal fluid protein n=1 Tax=Operophtera brumata TaxID=104452 RepID=A0A0L7LKB7_OPEBR|nr:Seminal fluid protein [Operophtera brumata]